METKICLSCKHKGRPYEHPYDDFYKDARGKPLPTCKTCRKEYNKSHYENSISIPSETTLARTVVTGTVEGPKIGVFRCASCYTKAVTRSPGDGKGPPTPKNWRPVKVPVNDHESTAMLCGQCSSLIRKARKALNRIVERIRAEETRAVTVGK